MSPRALIRVWVARAIKRTFGGDGGQSGALIRQGRPAPASPCLESTRLTEEAGSDVSQMHLGLITCASHSRVRNNKLPLIRLKIKTGAFTFLLLFSDLLGGICYNHFIQLLFLMRHLRRVVVSCAPYPPSFSNHKTSRWQ